MERRGRRPRAALGCLDSGWAVSRPSFVPNNVSNLLSEPSVESLSLAATLGLGVVSPSIEESLGGLGGVKGRVEERDPGCAASAGKSFDFPGKTVEYFVLEPDGSCSEPSTDGALATGASGWSPRGGEKTGAPRCACWEAETPEESPLVVPTPFFLSGPVMHKPSREWHTRFHLYKQDHCFISIFRSSLAYTEAILDVIGELVLKDAVDF